MYTYFLHATDPDGDTLTYTWHFNDGTPDIVTPDSFVTHAFAGVAGASTRSYGGNTVQVTDGFSTALQVR